MTTGDLLAWTYDAVDNRRTLETDQGITTYTYNAVGQLTKLVNEHDEVTSFAYDGAGREVRKDLDNGTWASTVYDPAGRITSVSNFYRDHELISRFTYTYDAAGNRTAEGREEGELRLWKYDPTSQLCP